MEDRLLKFARIVDAGSFTRAAQVMHISQPALTTAVKKLEKELQAPLLLRGGHSLQLTPAGQLAYASAGQLLHETKNLRTQLQQIGKQKPLLQLGMIDSLATMLFVTNALLPQIEHDMQLSLTIDNSARLIELVQHNELDIALVAQPQQLPRSIQTLPVGEEPLVLVAHPAILPAVQAQIKQKKLSMALGYNQRSNTYRLIASHFARAGIEFEPQFFSTSPEIILQLVLAGRGAAVLPVHLVKEHLEKQNLLYLSVGGQPVIKRQIIALRQRGRLLPTATQTLLSAAKQHLDELLAAIG